MPLIQPMRLSAGTGQPDLARPAAHCPAPAQDAIGDRLVITELDVAPIASIRVRLPGTTTATQQRCRTAVGHLTGGLPLCGAGGGMLPAGGWGGEGRRGGEAAGPGHTGSWSSGPHGRRPPVPPAPRTSAAVDERMRSVWAFAGVERGCGAAGTPARLFVPRARSIARAVRGPRNSALPLVTVCPRRPGARGESR